MHPQAAAYLWDKWKRNYFDLRIRTFWLDPCDGLHSIRDYTTGCGTTRGRPWKPIVITR